ncbi:hypothetical protein FHT86_003530 [Rhizobium sp. BK313]|uniref:hypothetical protein n=1 Tax=Rhizobium sp. BK313 TaxID=2587081 RepID=UPI00105E5BAE|nr:hypothetical protein [Rhizobium sp. BK313]MBB3455231.1 hypothetical protein [Rhizobium sp. BK313]
MGMKLSKSETIIGLPAVTARDIVAKHLSGGDWFYLKAVEYALQAEVCFEKKRGYKYIDYEAAAERAPALLAKMMEEGYVEKGETDTHEEYGKRQSYRPTDKGLDLSRVKFVKRMSRAKAIEQLQAFLDPVEAINVGEYVYVVTDVWLYGSLITDAADIGDVDLVYKTDWREGHCGYADHVQHNKARADTSGQNLDFYGVMRFGSVEIERILKDRRPHISLNGFVHHALHQMKGGYRQIVKDGVVLKDDIPQGDTK